MQKKSLTQALSFQEISKTHNLKTANEKFFEKEKDEYNILEEEDHISFNFERNLENGASKSKDFSSPVYIAYENDSKMIKQSFSSEMVESQKLMKSKLKLKLVSSDFPLFPEKPILSCDDKKSFQFKLQKENYLKNHPYRNLIFSPVVSEKEFIQHLIFTQKGLKYAKNCLKQPSEEIIRQKTFKFYEPKYKKTILIELEGVLVQTFSSSKEYSEHTIKFLNEQGKEIKRGFQIRPFCHKFLKIVSKYCDLYVFSAHQSEFVVALMSLLDPEKYFFTGFIGKNHCLKTANKYHIKDLRIFNDISPKNIILIDSQSHSFGFNIGNGVPVKLFKGDHMDQELKFLPEFLNECIQEEDSRNYLQKHLKLEELAKSGFY